MKVSLHVLSKLHNNSLVEGPGKDMPKATRERTKNLFILLRRSQEGMLWLSPKWMFCWGEKGERTEPFPNAFFTGA